MSDDSVSYERRVRSLSEMRRLRLATVEALKVELATAQRLLDFTETRLAEVRSIGEMPTSSGEDA